MKKLMVFLLCFCSIFCFFGCKEKKEDLSLLGENKTNYEIEIDLDVENKSASVKQTIDYVLHLVQKILDINLVLRPLKLNQFHSHNQLFA